MSSWSENWIYNLIPQEEYELAFDMVNGKSISCVLNQEEEIDYSKIEHVQEILELTLMDILKSEDVNEKDIAEVSQKIYLLLSALPMPVDSIEKAKHAFIFAWTVRGKCECLLPVCASLLFDKC